MSRPAVQVMAWAAYLAVLTIILWVWWGHPLSVAQLGSAAAATALIAIFFALTHRAPPRGEARREPGELRVLPDLSVGTVVVAIALCGMLYGAEFGLFLVAICGGLLVIGLWRLAVELRSERRRGGAP